MSPRDFIGATRARAYDFYEQVRLAQELTQRDGDEQSSMLFALLMVEIGYAVRRGCTAEDVIRGVRRLQPSGSVLDEVPTEPATPRAKAMQHVIQTDRTNIKWRRRWRGLLLSLRGKK